ncbi:MAG: signal peptide prediction [Betaproteobacteria bacterium]
MNARRLVIRSAAYAWAAPNSLAGLLAGGVVLLLGGKVRIVAGVAEFSGGSIAVLCDVLPASRRFCAITLGHCIVGTSERALDAVRAHERVHVGQCERWGPLFVPAYALSSAWQWLRGRRAYRDNAFERQAYAIDGRMPLAKT